jgi:MOSC domain-containing protein YiiM
MDTTGGTVIAVCLSPRKGIPKLPQSRASLLADFGFEGDRHAGSRSRQVSLLSDELLEELTTEGMAVGPGVLGENLTVRGLALTELSPGDWLQVGAEAVLEVVEPRIPCATLTAVDARLPEAVRGRAGILCRVRVGGVVRPGDPINRIENL